MIRDFEWTRPKIELLDGLQTGELFILEELEEHEGTKYLMSMPPFGIAEEDMDVVEEFAKAYPERMINYNDLYNRLILHRKEVENKAKKRMKDKDLVKKEAVKKKKEQESKLVLRNLEI